MKNKQAQLINKLQHGLFELPSTTSEEKASSAEETFIGKSQNVDQGVIDVKTSLITYLDKTKFFTDPLKKNKNHNNGIAL